jgi:hypothetical protein
VIGAQDDHLDPSLPRLLGNAGAPALPPPDAGLTNSTGCRSGPAGAQPRRGSLRPDGSAPALLIAQLSSLARRRSSQPLLLRSPSEL